MTLRIPGKGFFDLGGEDEYKKAVELICTRGIPADEKTFTQRANARIINSNYAEIGARPLSKMS